MPRRACDAPLRRSNSSLLVGAPGNAFSGVSPAYGVLARSVARQGKQHHDAEADRRQARRQSDCLRSVDVTHEAPIVVTTHDSISKIRAQLRPAKTASASPMSIKEIKATTHPAMINAGRPPSTVTDWRSSDSASVRGSTKSVGGARVRAAQWPRSPVRGKILPPLRKRSAQVACPGCRCVRLWNLGNIDVAHIDDRQVTVGDDQIAATVS